MHTTLIAPAELTPHLGDSRWAVVDCRFDLADPAWGESEYVAGHIPSAINMNVNAPDFDEKVTTLDKSKQHVVYCRTGRRSTTAAQKLVAAQVPTQHLAGGITAWQKENLPTTRP